MKEKTLTPKQQRFVQEYLIDLNATAAYLRAGYKCSEEAARRAASRLLTNVDVQAAIQKAQGKVAEKAEVTIAWVIDGLVRNFKRAMQEVAVVDKEGCPTGAYQYQGSVANKALELIGKHLGAFPEKHEITGKDGGPIQHEELTPESRRTELLGIIAALRQRATVIPNPLPIDGAN